MSSRVPPAASPAELPAPWKGRTSRLSSPATSRTFVQRRGGVEHARPGPGGRQAVPARHGEEGLPCAPAAEPHAREVVRVLQDQEACAGHVVDGRGERLLQGPPGEEPLLPASRAPRGGPVQPPWRQLRAVEWLPASSSTSLPRRRLQVDRNLVAHRRWGRTAPRRIHLCGTRLTRPPDRRVSPYRRRPPRPRHGRAHAPGGPVTVSRGDPRTRSRRSFRRRPQELVRVQAACGVCRPVAPPAPRGRPPGHAPSRSRSGRARRCRRGAEQPRGPHRRQTQASISARPDVARGRILASIPPDLPTPSADR